TSGTGVVNIHLCTSDRLAHADRRERRGGLDAYDSLVSERRDHAPEGLGPDNRPEGLGAGQPQRQAGFALAFVDRLHATAHHFGYIGARVQEIGRAHVWTPVT